MRRFWSKVAAASPDECWEWQAGIGSHGYGHFWLDGRTHRAHRVAWSVINGPIPEDACVLHSCDNARCVNPYHLSLGTHAENIRQRDARGRHWVPRGEASHHAKMTHEAAAAIRESTDPNSVLAVRYGVSPTLISLIRNGKRWAANAAP